MLKDNVYEKLIEAGKSLVQTKGADYLTARKLSAATGFSVGTIYNQFENMDAFLLELNINTLKELKQQLQNVVIGTDPYVNLNLYVDAFVNFVLKNKGLWFVLYNFHVTTNSKKLTKKYLRQMMEVVNFWKTSFNKAYEKMPQKEKKLSLQVLWLSIFSLSSYLTTQTLDNMSGVSKYNICKLLFNVYLAGLKVLNK